MNKKATFVSSVDSLNDLPNASRLLDHIKDRYKLKSDRALATMLEMEPSQVSKLRSGFIDITPGTILRVHDVTGLLPSKIRAIARGAE